MLQYCLGRSVLYLRDHSVTSERVSGFCLAHAALCVIFLSVCSSQSYGLTCFGYHLWFETHYCPLFIQFLQFLVVVLGSLLCVGIFAGIFEVFWCWSCLVYCVWYVFFCTKSSKRASKLSGWIYGWVDWVKIHEACFLHALVVWMEHSDLFFVNVMHESFWAASSLKFVFGRRSAVVTIAPNGTR